MNLTHRLWSIIALNPVWVLFISLSHLLPTSWFTSGIKSCYGYSISVSGQILCGFSPFLSPRKGGNWTNLYIHILFRWLTLLYKATYIWDRTQLRRLGFRVLLKTLNDESLVMLGFEHATSSPNSFTMEPYHPLRYHCPLAIRTLTENCQMYTYI